MGKAGSVTQFILRQLFRSADVNSLTAEIGADPLICHDEDDGSRCDFDIGSPLSGSVGHVVKHLYQREGYKIKTVDATGVIVHTMDPTAYYSIDIPVGGIIWWHKGLTGVPSLPSGWVECNGQVLSDPDSLLDGQTIPNINGLGHFIRGSATSGTVQSDQNKSHTHGPGTLGGSLTRDHGLPGYVISTGDYSGPVQLSPGTGLSWYESVPNFSVSGGTTSASTAGSPDETRPVNISMVAIMRVK